MSRPVIDPTTQRTLTRHRYDKDQLQRRPPIGGGCSEGPWHYVDADGLFENGWADINGSLVLTRFRTFCDEVEIELCCEGPAGVTIFTLPVGFRPLVDQPGIVGDGTGTGAQNIQVLSDGSVFAL